MDNVFIRVILTLGLAACGGWVFSIIYIPLAWLLGAMVVTTIAAMANVPLKIPGRMRDVVIAILGIMLGSAFTPEVLAYAERWIITLSVLVVYISLITIGTGYFFYRVTGFGAITSFFSATPGGLSIMAILGGEAGGDMRTIALVHSIRVMLTVLVIPFWFWMFQGYSPEEGSTLSSIIDLTSTDAVMLILCGVIGYPLGRILRLPSPILIGSMLTSAAIHLAGSTTASPPVELVNVAQLVIGASIGSRFVGISVAQVLSTLKISAVTTIYMLSMAAFFGIILEAATGIPFPALLLAFAPGGLAEMALVSLSMGIDTAFVSTHHLTRVLVMIMTAPLVFAYLKTRYGIVDDHPRDDIKRTQKTSE